MPTESVEILIEAQDLASAKFKDVTKSAENSIRQIKDVSGKAKASTEFAGTLANLLGGTQLGSFASQLAGLTEKTAQFSEVSKAGGAGAMAFKAGLVGAAAVGAYQFSKFIGKTIFDMSEFSRQIKQTEKDVATSTAGMAAALGRENDFRRQEIELIKDPEQKKAAYSGLIKSLEADMASLSGVIAKSEEDVRSYEKSFSSWFDFTGKADSVNEGVKARVESEKQMLEGLRSQRDALVAVNSERARGIEELRKETALREKSDSYLEGLRNEIELLKAKKGELAGIEAGRNTFGDGAKNEAIGLLNERDALKALSLKDELLGKIEQETTLFEQGTAAARERELIMQGLAKTEASMIAAKEANLRFEKQMRTEAEQLAAQEEANRERIEGLIQAENEKLEERRILLEQGATEAAAFRLMQQGIAEDEARRIAEENAQLDRDEALRKEAPGLQATESRLLTRGTAVDKQLMALLNLQAEARQQNENLKGLREDNRRNKPVRINMVN